MYAGLLRAMTSRGVRVRGVVAGDPAVAGAVPANLSFFERLDAPVARRLSACRREAKSVLRAFETDVVAAHFALYALPVLDLLRDRRFVVHFHGPWANESRAETQRGVGVAAKRAIEAFVYRRADRCIVLSRAFAEILAREYRVAAERIRVVPGGVDAGRYASAESRAAARDAMQLPSDRPLIVSVRRLVHRVGLEGLIDAMTIVRRRVPEALLLIAGTGPLASELAARVAGLGLEQHVRLLGFVPETQLPRLYRACQVSVVPSVALEGFGLTTIESLAAGTPVLVTPVGGLPETVHELEPGLVLAGCDAAAIADGLTQALTGGRRLPDLDACTRYARTYFDWPVVASRVLGVYGERH
jgi:glycosyltransferase involved in cell wall biosynthesis